MHLYLHIPFCRQACHYCDFHFSTNLKLKEEIIEAICEEIRIRKDYLGTNKLSTIYVGGGTPSLLTKSDLSKIFTTIQQNFTILPDAEISLEANPEDLNPIYLKELNEIGINRLSIGIQSFHEKNLPYLNRNHSIQQSLEAIKNAKKQGFDKISLDLIFGIPGNSMEDLRYDLEQLIACDVDHISCYSLTIEPKTYFGNLKKKGQFKETDESLMEQQFIQIIDTLEAHGFEQYEVSNFAKNGQISIHNSSYWFQESYLGIGPSAHSYNGVSRQWNVSSNGKYVKGIMNNEPYFEKEELKVKDILNEMVMTRLRTKWGLPMQEFNSLIQENKLENPELIIKTWISEGKAKIEGEHLILTKNGKLIADKLSSDIFFI
ncbi:radical SAM family heme chaperone HemW [Sandaracinomonas limnophila]|uniref:Heme chaperone HemW n=1 Tax=Sandaracinomonas limnophila TaxID=1862386 RepID=A0A437PW42_9BACT|nr:radical SAM family heme chaperone HemW [Sandaracinomonas limnophila]RVU26479.1 radical SAM family heme chaperone HemW [Sandaracinomonas limnophila]